MNRSRLLHMPPFRVVTPATNNWAAFWTAEDWRGKSLLSRESPFMPAMYHKGTWLASQGYSPEQADPIGISPFYSVTMLYRQFGSRQWGKKGTVPRIPCAILYNGMLGDAPVSETQFAFMNNLLLNLSDELDEKSVFTASIGELFSPAFLTNSFPILGNESGGFHIEPEQWEGGNLLVLRGIAADGLLFWTPTGQDFTYGYATGGGVYGAPPVATGVWSQIISPYIQIQSADVYGRSNLFTVSAPDSLGIPGTSTPAPWGGEPVLAAQPITISHDIPQLAECAERFNNFTSIIYLRTRGTTPYTFVAAQTVPILKTSIGTQASPHGLTVKGPHLRTEDLTAIITADILAWLATL